ncbi:unnamed protein product [Rotaria sp. Silwood1]|nr:unnamed protein product [Rotaria sp. Silwood1]CAF1616516.1 unnamed protein product [Rotaria sp. Silwood1]CAF3699724.1 unnamed protein product [Rotaria sp. Silwood1]CAF3729733.1 unnamed protein product [Rotaria sp. Silwood1]CAF3743952.1 unnamed protein product [Rotaria sp. Silwood1]
MRIDYDLILLQPAQECCPQSSERVIRIICNDPRKNAVPIASNPYIPINYNRSKTHIYCGYLDILVLNHSSIKNNTTNTNSLFLLQLTNHFQTPMTSISSLPESSTQQHFAHVLMIVSVRQTLSIIDMQVNTLLGPKEK